MNPSSGSTDLLQWLTELWKSIYSSDYWFLTKDTTWNSQMEEMCKARYLGRGSGLELRGLSDCSSGEASENGHLWAPFWLPCLATVGAPRSQGTSGTVVSAVCLL